MSGLLGPGLALASALAWGSGDFSGGLAARRTDTLRVVLITALAGTLILAALAVARGEPLPGGADLAWAASGGAAGALGLFALFRGLATASTALVAPTSAVVAAGLPVVYGALSVGLPAPVQLAGFGFGLAGIWLVAREGEPGGGGVARALGLGAAAGVGFGAFFILIAQVGDEALFAHLAVARAATLAVTVAVLLAQRGALPSLAGAPLAWLAGLLDSGGNTFYLLALQYTRIDVAAVLASLYPAATVLLAWTLMRQAISVQQWVGVACCLAAVALIAG